jgi:nucleoside-diphosphate-sugar epimerase
VIDLSGFTENQVKNSFKHLTFDRYIYISSTAVNGYPFNNASPDKYDMMEYAKNKFECENFIKANIDNYLIIRPCYIVGQGDNTNRFFSLGGEWYWKHNRKKLNYFIKVENVCQLVEKHIESKDIGIVLPCD